MLNNVSTNHQASNIKPNIAIIIKPKLIKKRLYVLSDLIVRVAGDPVGRGLDGPVEPVDGGAAARVVLHPVNEFMKSNDAN